MSQTITCPNCKNTIEISEAITSEIKDKVLAEHEKQHKEQIEKLLKEKHEAEESAENKIEQAKRDLELSIRKEEQEKLQKEYLVKLENAQNEAEERDKQNKELREQLTELLKQNRDMKEKDDQREIEFQKKLIEEQDLIKQKARQSVLEETQLSMAQKEKVIEDLKKQLTDAQRKAEQGSQQTQGEVQELIIEELIKREFPYDEIREVPKGIEGADVIQVVKNASGIECGVIVWESKNTKAWSQGWIAKLKNDQRSLKAEIAVIISKVLPEGVRSFGQVEGVWVADLPAVLGVATALRMQLIQIANAKAVSANMANKAEVVYEYLTGNAFKQRIEYLVEYFKQRKEEMDKEKAYFTKKWDKEDKNIQLFMQNTAGIYGDLQGLIGNALPKVSYLELETSEDSEQPSLDL